MNDNKNFYEKYWWIPHVIPALALTISITILITILIIKP